MTSQCEFEPGDVVFRRTQRSSIDDLIVNGQFASEFADLAAYAQTFPYIYASSTTGSRDPADYKPWHHVEAIVSDKGGVLMLSGFDSEEPYTESGEVPLLQERTLDEAELNDEIASRSATVLRPPSDARDFAAALGGIGSPEYSIAGLIAFALATEMRMLPAGQMRDELAVLASRADATAHAGQYDNAENCVTPIAKAAAVVWPSIEFRELDPPMVPTDGIAALAQLNRIKALLRRVAHSNQSGGAAPLREVFRARHAAPETLARRRRRATDIANAGDIGGEIVAIEHARAVGVDLGEILIPDMPLDDMPPMGPIDDFLGPNDPVAVPGDIITTTVEYFDVLEEALDVFEGGLRGSDSSPTQMTPRSLRISPAILFDALVEQVGFSVVTPTPDP